MPDYDRGFKIVAHESGQQLCELAGVRCQGWSPIVDTVQATERLADRAFVARQGRQRFVVYFEAYTRWSDSARWSVLAKSALLSEREELPTRTLIFILLPRGYRPQQGQFRLEVGGEPTQQVWFREVCLWQQTPQAWWEQVPGLMALYPLCHHAKPRREAMTYPAQKIAVQVTDPRIRADLLTTLSIFGKLAYPDLNVIELIGREQMKESKFFEEVMAEGRAEGDLRTARTAVRRALEARFGAAVAAQFDEALQGFSSADQLLELIPLTIQARRPADFRRSLIAATMSR